MRRPWAGNDGMRRGWLGQLTALAALLGFLFSATTPGLSLVAMAGPSITIDGFLGIYICHVQSGPSAALPGETDSPKSDGCCLICQVAQLANGAVPPQHFTLPTESAAHARTPVSAQIVVQGEASRHAQARAPPAA